MAKHICSVALWWLQLVHPSPCSSVFTSTGVTWVGLQFPAPPHLHSPECWQCPCPGRWPTSHGYFHPLIEKKTPANGLHMEGRAETGLSLQPLAQHVPSAPAAGSWGETRRPNTSHEETSAFSFPFIFCVEPPSTAKGRLEGAVGLQLLLWSPQTAPQSGLGPCFAHAAGGAPTLHGEPTR